MNDPYPGELSLNIVGVFSPPPPSRHPPLCLNLLSVKNDFSDRVLDRQ